MLSLSPLIHSQCQKPVVGSSSGSRKFQPSLVDGVDLGDVAVSVMSLVVRRVRYTETMSCRRVGGDANTKGGLDRRVVEKETWMAEERLRRVLGSWCLGLDSHQWRASRLRRKD